MSSEISIPKANPNLEATGGFQFLNRPMQSQYYESEFSVFGNPYNGQIGTTPGSYANIATPLFPGAGLGYGGGMMGGMYGLYGNVDQYVENAKKWNNGYHDIMDNNSDRSSETEMKNQSNRNIVNGLADSLIYDISRMKDNIANNDMRQACDNYDNLYKLIAKREGVEIEYHNGRIIKNEHINAQIAKCYKEITGSELMGDISANGDSDFQNGFKRAITLGAYEQGSADEIKAYMTGDRLQDTAMRKMNKSSGAGLAVGTIGAVGGASVGFLAGAAKGAKAGKSAGGKGAIIGAIIGGLAGIIGGSFLGNSTPDKSNLEKCTTY